MHVATGTVFRSYLHGLGVLFSIVLGLAAALLLVRERFPDRNLESLFLHESAVSATTFFGVRSCIPPRHARLDPWHVCTYYVGHCFQITLLEGRYLPNYNRHFASEFCTLLVYRYSYCTSLGMYVVFGQPFQHTASSAPKNSMICMMRFEANANMFHISATADYYVAVEPLCLVPPWPKGGRAPSHLANT